MRAAATRERSHVQSAKKYPYGYTIYTLYYIYMDPDDYRHMTTESHGIFGTLNPNRSSWQRQDLQDFLRL